MFFRLRIEKSGLKKTKPPFRKRLFRKWRLLICVQMAYDGNFKPYTFMLFEGWELNGWIFQLVIDKNDCHLPTLNAKIKHFL